VLSGGHIAIARYDSDGERGGESAIGGDFRVGGDGPAVAPVLASQKINQMIDVNVS
jgi:hypothetical protein